MYKPHKEKEDFYYTAIIASVFGLIVSAVITYGVMDTGLKRLLLTNFGAQTSAVVEKVVCYRPLKPADFVRIAFENAAYLEQTDLLTLRYSDSDGTVFRSEVLLLEEDDTLALGQTIPQSYLPINPAISYPTDFLDKFAFDQTFMTIGLFITLVFVFLFIISIRALKQFRRRTFRY